MVEATSTKKCEAGVVVVVVVVVVGCWWFFFVESNGKSV